MNSALGRFGPLLAAAALLLLFFDIGRAYDGFRLYNGPPSGYHVHPIEGLFYAYQGAFSLLLGAALAACVWSWELGDKLLDLGRRAVASRLFLPAACLSLFLLVLLIKDFALQGTPISDDEHTFDFIAKTLLAGRVKNPAPEGDADFYRSTFVVMKDGAWYGKYSIGHPLVLALGELLRLRFVIIPLVSVGTFALTFLLAERLFDRTTAALSAALLLSSPHFVMTAATEASQTTGGLMLLLSAFALVRFEQRRALGWLLVGGAAAGFGFLARPLPGVLFGPVLYLYLLTAERGPLIARVQGTLPFVIALVPVAAVVFVTNAMQSGSAFVSGYQEIHGTLGLTAAPTNLTSHSLFGSLLRQVFWTFGGPVLFLLVPIAFLTPGPRRRLWLLAGLIAANYSYRIVSPKLFVSTTGPIYLSEHVPLLAVLAAAGALELHRRAQQLGSAHLAQLTVATFAGAWVAGLSLFVPVELAALARNAAVHRFIPDALTLAPKERSLVFATILPRPGQGESWALGPPNPDPRGVDRSRVLYVRVPADPAELHRFWRERHPDRGAYVLDQSGLLPKLVPVENIPANVESIPAAQ